MSADQPPPTTNTRRHAARSRTSLAAKPLDQPPVAPQVPTTHEAEQWNRYREAWEVYFSQQEQSQPGVPQPETQQYREAWQAHWKVVGQLWRKQPEIAEPRQGHLAERRRLQADWRQGIFPFKDIPLSRADVEWLLATHEDGRGPVDWGDPLQRRRARLDLRGSLLYGEDLRRLPLARVLFGPPVEEGPDVVSLQGVQAAAHLEDADLRYAHLEGAVLRYTHLEGARLAAANLESANLSYAELAGANLKTAHLEGATLWGAHLEGKAYSEEYLKHQKAPQVTSSGRWEPANLLAVFFDRSSIVENALLGDERDGVVSLLDVHWGEVHLDGVHWNRDPSTKKLVLGEERRARLRMTPEGQPKDQGTRQHEYKEAVRTNRQLAIVLQAQGQNELAAQFVYQAQRLQRQVLWHDLWTKPQLGRYPVEHHSSQQYPLRGFQKPARGIYRKIRTVGALMFNVFLEVLAGYGYRPGRALAWYLAVTSGFALVYATLGHLPYFPDALVLSLTSFHGRGFFPGLGTTPSLHDPLVVSAALEAVIGLFIEISFIATFTQRFFGR